jgi:hypothetical protein
MALVACAGGACGEAVVSGDAYDQPLFTFRGVIRPAGELASVLASDGVVAASRPRVSLLWTDPLQRQPDVPAPPYSVRSSVGPDDTFVVEVFRRPPPAALVDITAPGGETAKLALAEIVVIDDADGDGGFRVNGPRADIEAPDAYLGASPNVLVYVLQPFPKSLAGDDPIAPASTTGFAVVSYDCSGPRARPAVTVKPDDVDLVVARSVALPEVRTCRRSHSP